VILHVLYAERDKTFRGYLTFLADPTRPIENALSSMLTTAHDPAGQLAERIRARDRHHWLRMREPERVCQSV
jgi:hypothetical protein